MKTYIVARYLYISDELDLEIISALNEVEAIKQLFKLDLNKESYKNYTKEQIDSFNAWVDELPIDLKILLIHLENVEIRIKIKELI